MQIVNEKPQIDLVFKANTRPNRQEIKQKDRYTDAFEIYSCLTESETANFETQNPKMKSLISFNTSTLSGNTCNVENSGLNLLQSVKNNSSNLELELTETGLQIVTGWTAEICFCPLVREDWN
jgi:hypothetical protein